MAYVETDFQQELLAAFRDAHCVAHKFPDIAKRVTKPHDLVLGVGGYYVAVECKLCKVGTRANPGHWHPGLIVVREKDLSVGQHRALRETAERHSHALVIAGVYDVYDYRREAFAWEYADFTRKEFWTLHESRLRAIRLSWQPGKGWGVEPIIQYVVASKK